MNEGVRMSSALSYCDSPPLLLHSNKVRPSQFPQRDTLLRTGRRAGSWVRRSPASVVLVGRCRRWVGRGWGGGGEPGVLTKGGLRILRSGIGRGIGRPERTPPVRCTGNPPSLGVPLAPYAWLRLPPPPAFPFSLQPGPGLCTLLRRIQRLPAISHLSTWRQEKSPAGEGAFSLVGRPAIGREAAMSLWPSQTEVHPRADRWD
mmetsp:Transcript_14092/g.19409  ORF Transcript_14092/g.19409 Transcript_14092/m.19409 type:complete len:203 (-) Transcript_14092:29-637(-)